MAFLVIEDNFPRNDNFITEMNEALNLLQI